MTDALHLEAAFLPGLAWLKREYLIVACLLIYQAFATRRGRRASTF